MKILTTLILCFYLTSLMCQEDKCNELGVWLWHIEQTGLTHELLAKNLSSLGVQRVYVKVADGRINPERWTELVDTNLVQTYKAEGLQVWAWSYNYTEHDSLQAAALTQAVKTGYQGYVIDVEMEFDGKPLALFNLSFAFHKAQQQAIHDGLAPDDFPLYCTTWGNPKLHNYPISVMDPYIDGYMPQTYVEVWGDSYLEDIPKWIERGLQEYEELGATKPLHHICATQSGRMTAEEINLFIEASGGESSLWRVPGGGLGLSVWQDWAEVEWGKDFCEPISSNTSINAEYLKIFPNPTFGLVYIEGENIGDKKTFLYNAQGQLLLQKTETQLDLSAHPAGLYIIRVEGYHEGYTVIKW